MKGPFEEDFDEMPPKERPSQYDFLRDSIDGKVVVLPRGEVLGFGEKTSMAVLRAALSKWAASRGVKVELRYIWFDWRASVEQGGRWDPERASSTAPRFHRTSSRR